MFKSFFQKKEETTSKPPSHRPQNPTGQREEPTGGGFFNLPPPPMKHPSPPEPPGPPGPSGPPSGVPEQHHAGGPPAPMHTGGAPGGFHRPVQQQQPPQQYPPHRGSGSHDYSPQLQPSQPPHYGGGSLSHPPPSGGGLDMFGGMSIKNPSSAPPASTYHAPSSQQYGAPPHSIAPPPAAAPPSHPSPTGNFSGNAASLSHQLLIQSNFSQDSQPPLSSSQGGGGLFSGLDVASSGGNASPQNDLNRTGSGRRIGSRGSTGSFNYLDVGGEGNGSGPPSRSGSISGMAGVTKVTKKVKKKKTFRPGFGRQLSDESIAALQRGDLKEEDIIQQEPELPPTSISSSTSSGSSVLAGLTVHNPGSVTTNNEGSSVLAGLTVHAPTGSNTPRATGSTPTSGAGGILAGLNIRGGGIPAEPASPEGPSKIPANTPESRLFNELKDFQASSSTFKKQQQKQTDEETRLLSRKLQLAKQLTEYEIDLQDVETQQQQACEMEDFEKADMLNASINSVRHCITLTQSDIRKTDLEIGNLVKQKEKTFTSQLKSCKMVLQAFETFQKDQRDANTNLKKELEEYDTKEKQTLAFEKERIESELHHVEVNLEHLQQERKEIEDTIEEQCKEDFVVVRALESEEAAVQLVIDELEKQLAKERERMNEILGKKQVASVAIDKVRDKFRRQLKRITEREDNVLQTKREVEKDVKMLSAQEENYIQQKENYQKQSHRYKSQIRMVKKHKKLATWLSAVFEQQEKRKESNAKNSKSQHKELDKVEDEFKAAEQSHRMLQKQLDDLERSLSIHQNAIASADSMIPKLELEKKTAATARNFKDAAKISKEIKTLEKEKENAEEMVEVVQMESGDLKQRVEEKDTEVKEKEAAFKEAEKKLELSSLASYWQEAKDLRRILKKIQAFEMSIEANSDSSSEDADAREELSNQFKDFKESAEELVQGELTACTLLVLTLEKKHDVTDPNPDNGANVESEEDEDEEEDESEPDEQPVRVTASSSPRKADVKSEVTDGEGADDDDEDEDDEEDEVSTVAQADERLNEYESLIEKATENEDYEFAAELDEKMQKLRKKREELVELERVSKSPSSPEPVIQSATVAAPEPGTNAQVDAVVETRDRSNSTMNELQRELDEITRKMQEIEDKLQKASEEEDYEHAAVLDETLQSLSAQKEEIELLLDGSPPRPKFSTSSAPSEASKDVVSENDGSIFAGMSIPTSPPSPTPSPVTLDQSVSDEVVTSSETSMFGGLEINQQAVGVKNATSESGMFGGLQINQPTPGDSQISDNGSSIFGGLSVNDSATTGSSSVPSSPRRSPSVRSRHSSSMDETSASPTEPNIIGELATAISSPKEGAMISGNEINSTSPRRKNSIKSNSEASPRSLPSPRRSSGNMLDEPQVNTQGSVSARSSASPRASTPKHKSSPDMFGGLAVNQLTTKSQSPKPLSPKVASPVAAVNESNSIVSGLSITEPPASPKVASPVAAVNQSISMFGDLSVSQAPASPKVASPVAETSSVSSSMFGALNINQGASSPKLLSPSASSPKQLSSPKPSDSSSDPMSMFEGLSLNPAPSSPLKPLSPKPISPTAASGSMFGGLSMNNTASPSSPSSNMFGGLQVQASSSPSLAASATEATSLPVTDGTSSSLLGGLNLAATTSSSPQASNSGLSGISLSSPSATETTTKSPTQDLSNLSEE